MIFGYFETFEELYDRGLDSDFNVFEDKTGGFIYLIHTSGQIEMIFIEDCDDLCQYFSCKLSHIEENPSEMILRIYVEEQENHEQY